MTQVAFEVDSIDEATNSGWSVLVRGQADCIADAVDATSERIRRLTLITWAASITGRRLRVLPATY
jgi:uncharacterized protein